MRETPPAPDQTGGSAGTEDSAFWQRITVSVFGDEGAGFAFSFLIHTVVLAVMAIPVVPRLMEDRSFTTLVENATHEEAPLSAPIDTLSLDPEVAQSAEKFQSQLLDLESTDKQPIPVLSTDAQNSDNSEADDDGAGEAGQGSRIPEPENAVKAGNFSVWHWPIDGTMVGTEIQHGVPGASPKVGQHYSIVIRVKVPEGRTYVRLAEFTGSVVGTDGYEQRIPNDAWFYRRNGEMVKAQFSHRIPVIDGTAEIMIRVPGALRRAVKDTITVRSRTIDEEETIELVFQSAI